MCCFNLPVQWATPCLHWAAGEKVCHSLPLPPGRSNKEKELRNEVLIVANLIARHRKSHAPFRAAHLLQLLLLYATAAEKNALVSGSGNDPNDPDGPLEVGVTHASVCCS